MVIQGTASVIKLENQSSSKKGFSILPRMKPSPLSSRPDFIPQYNSPYNAEYEASLAKGICDYFRMHMHWPWQSEEQRKIYAEQDTELWLLLLRPRGRAEVGG
jgi:hypothetical protein